MILKFIPILLSASVIFTSEPDDENDLVIIFPVFDCSGNHLIPNVPDVGEITPDNSSRESSPLFQELNEITELLKEMKEVLQAPAELPPFKEETPPVIEVGIPLANVTIPQADPKPPIPPVAPLGTFQRAAQHKKVRFK